MSSTNGHSSLSLGNSALAVDPMEKVLGTGERVPGELMIVGAIGLHLLLGGAALYIGAFDAINAWQRGIRDEIAYKLGQEEIEVVKESPPPPPPEEKPPEPEPEKAPPPATPPPEAAPPKPAEAGKVLTSDPTPNEPVDLTNTIVQGSGDTYAGGVSSSDGTSKHAIYNPAAASTGVPGGTGTVPAPAAPARRSDMSRVPGLLGSSDWNDCPFPGEADAEQIDRQAVLIQVNVQPDGSPASVTVVQDPGHGFGREAQKCAMRKRYAPGLDADGKPVSGTTKPFRVRFER